jgi:hypothetical protein
VRAHVRASLRFMRKGVSLYHVFDGDTQLGWMDDRTIGLLGFVDPADARRAGTAGYATAVTWHWAVGHDGRGPKYRLPGADATAEEHRIEVDGAVVGRVVRTSRAGEDGERFGFELVRSPGQPFAASVHLFHRLLSVAVPPDRSPELSMSDPTDARPVLERATP